MWFFDSPKTKALKLIGIIHSAMHTVKFFDERIKKLNERSNNLIYSRGIRSSNERILTERKIRKEFKENEVQRDYWLKQITDNQAKLEILLKKHPKLREDETLKRYLNPK